MDYYENIKTELINNEVYKRVKDYSKNRKDLETYYNVGKLLHDAGKHYGDGIIKEYSKKLTLELGKGYTFTALSRMRQFYLLNLKIATLSQQLTVTKKRFRPRASARKLLKSLETIYCRLEKKLI